MIFDVVKATTGFSKWENKQSTRTLVFEVTPSDRYELDFGADHVLIGSGYHRFTVTDRKPVTAKVWVGTDRSIIEHDWPEKSVCGSAHYSGGEHDAELGMYVVVEPDVFEAMARVQIKEPGAATLMVDIEELEFGNRGGLDGTHQVWKLEGKKRDWATRKPVSHFWLHVDSFWTNERRIREARDEQMRVRLADSPDPEDREFAARSEPEKPDPIIGLLRQCRLLLVALVIVASLSFFRFA